MPAGPIVKSPLCRALLRCSVWWCIAVLPGAVIAADARPIAKPAPDAVRSSAVLSPRAVRIRAATHNPPERPAPPLQVAPYTPTGTETPEELEEAYRNSREWRKRVDVLRQLIEQYPDEPDWVFRLAATYSAMRWYDDAIDSYVTFATKWPEEPRFKDACIAISDDMRRAGRAEEDFKYLGTLPKDTPEWDIWVSVKQSESLNYHLRRDFDLSDRLCEDLIARYPGHPLLYMACERLADNYLNACKPERRKYAQAQAMYARLLAEYPDKPGAFFWHIRLSEAASFQGDLKTAIEHRRIAIEKYPEDCPRDNWQCLNRYMLGALYEKSGDKTAAERQWRQVMERYPSDGWALRAKERLGLVKVEAPEPSMAEGEISRTYGAGNPALKGLKVLVRAPQVAPISSAPMVVELSRDGQPLENATVTVLWTAPGGKEQALAATPQGGGRFTTLVDLPDSGEYGLGFRIQMPQGLIGPDDLTRQKWIAYKTSTPRITTAALAASAPAALTFVDCREHPTEWVRGALRITLPRLDEDLAQLPKANLIVVYSAGGFFDFAPNMVVRLVEKGYRAAALYGGFPALQAAGYPTDKETE